MRNQYVYAGLAALLLLIGGITYLTLGLKEPAPELPTLRINGENIHVIVADTAQERGQGLSGREGLADGEGMLFVFAEDGLHGFWMKDMRFSIDIIWIAADGTVVDMLENVSPDTYPQTFHPKTPARFVLELPAGEAAQLGLDIGDAVEL